MKELIAVAAGYLLGSIPFGLLLSAIAGIGDIRKVGSGNIGATNVLRTGHKSLALLTLLLDGTKGYVAVTLTEVLAPRHFEPHLAAAVGAMVGHCFPVWLGFKGGKGVATLLGISFAVDPQLGLAAVITWLAVLVITRISSLAGISSAIVLPVVAYHLGGHRIVLVLSILAALVVVQHRDNITRLFAGKEPRVGSRG